MATWRFKVKREFLGQLWKQGSTIELPEDYFEALKQEVPREMELDKGPESEPDPRDVSAWRGKRDHSGEGPEQKAHRQVAEAKAAAAPDTGPPGEDAEDEDGDGDLGL